jgi:hypothetical protein
MRRMLMAAVVAAALGWPATAGAAIPSVFGGSVACTAQASGQRFCSGIVPSWDGTGIDVNVAFPPAAGADASWPLIGLYHGWGGTKLPLTGADAQRALSRGYAVFTITDRGWGASCGAATKTRADCAHGYIHLMHDAYEVRDAQFLMGRLADDGAIDPQRIGAAGGSYGGGMAIALGALRNRTMLPDGSLVPWTSPNGKAMQIAATTPEFTWSDLDYALMPNGATLDYVADAPYRGPLGDRRVGVQKQSWNGNLYLAGQVLGFYAPIGSDPAADITGWKAVTDSGGPFDASPAAQAMTDELARNHSAYYIDDSVAPAPALLSNGWNDDLFPVDEAVRYYNKVRADHPDTPISLFDLDFGHNPRAGAIAPGDADAAALAAAENAWMDYYVKGAGTKPADAVGGVDILTSTCPVNTAGTHYHASSWGSLAPGEVRLDTTGTQTIAAPGTAPSDPFTSGDICRTTGSADNASGATYKVPAATTAYTLAGSPTVVATLNVTGANDAVYERLYDVNGATEQLIARGLYRPTGVGTSRQVFQLHPQAWTVQPGHSLKLELLGQDSPYARTAAAAAPQQAIQVTDLQLRLPVVDAPGSALGNGVTVQSPAAKVLPAGYRLSRDFAVSATGGVGGSVPSALALTVNGPASFGTFTPGVAGTYTAGTTADVLSTAGDATLAVTDPGANPGHLVNGAFVLPGTLQARADAGAFAPVGGSPLTLLTYNGPVSHAPVALQFQQAIGTSDPLRTGTYAKTLTFTLSTTSP